MSIYRTAAISEYSDIIPLWQKRFAAGDPCKYNKLKGRIDE